MAQRTKQSAPWRIFVSSTYEDMIPYREAVSEALTSIEQLPIGMKHFVSAPDKPLDVCLTDVRRCQLYIVLVGMRYGSIDEESGKSITELEYRLYFDLWIAFISSQRNSFDSQAFEIKEIPVASITI